MLTACLIALDDADLLDKANPLRVDGTITLDSDAIEARQDAQVRIMVGSGKFAFAMLGGAHELHDNIRNAAGGSCEYVTITTQRYLQFAASEYSPSKRKPEPRLRKLGPR